MLLLPGAPGSVAMSAGEVVLRDGVIASVTLVESLTPAEEQTILSPGFIDAHLHLPQFDSLGVAGLELLDWLRDVIFPAEIRWNDPEYAAEMSARVARQLLSFGTTGVAAYATSSHAGAQAAIAELARAGLCGHVAQVLMDVGAPEELCVGPDRAIPQTRDLAGTGRIQPSLAPRFALSCSNEMLQLSGKLARTSGRLVQTHLSETVAEVAAVRERFGTGYVDVYEWAGLLGERSVLAHGVQLTRAGAERLAASGSVIAHCPTANAFLRAGRMNRAMLLAAGVRPALGSDVAGGPERSMVRVARAMAETAATVDPAAPPISAGECFWQITGGNSRALGLSKTGRLEEGFDADVVVIRPDIRWREALDPLAAVLYGWDDRWVARVYAAGSSVYP